MDSEARVRDHDGRIYQGQVRSIRRTYPACGILAGDAWCLAHGNLSRPGGRWHVKISARKCQIDQPQVFPRGSGALTLENGPAVAAQRHCLVARAGARLALDRACRAAVRARANAWASDDVRRSILPSPRAGRHPSQLSRLGGGSSRWLYLSQVQRRRLLAHGPKPQPRGDEASFSKFCLAFPRASYNSLWFCSFPKLRCGCFATRPPRKPPPRYTRTHAHTHKPKSSSFPAAHSLQTIAHPPLHPGPNMK